MTITQFRTQVAKAGLRAKKQRNEPYHDIEKGGAYLCCVSYAQIQESKDLHALLSLVLKPELIPREVRP